MTIKLSLNTTNRQRASVPTFINVHNCRSMPRYLVDSLQLKTNAPRDVIPPFPCRTKSNGNWFIAFLTASFKLLANSWQLCCKPPMVHDSSIILSVYRIQPKIAHWLNSQDHYLANVLLTYVTTFINKKPGSRKHSQPYCMTANYHLQLFSRYWALSVLRSRVWPFGGQVTSSVTWPFDTP